MTNDDETKTTERAPFATRSLLLSWLSDQGLGHVARLSLEAAAPRLEPSLWPQLHAVGARRRLIELASEESRVRSIEWLPAALREALPAAVWAVVEDERGFAAASRDAVASIIEPPGDARALSLHERLSLLRERFPATVAPLPVTSAQVSALKVDAALPGFRFRDTRRYESRLRGGGGFVLPEVRLTVAQGKVSTECTCGETHCVHALSAIDTAFSWLRQPPSETLLRSLDALSRPAWERTLSALDRALEEGDEDRGGALVTWRLRVDATTGIEVSAWVQKLAAKGARSPAVRLGRRRLRLEHGAGLSAVDARVASLLPEDGEPASRAVLDALVSHPLVVSAEEPDVPVQLERALVGLVANERRGSVRVGAAVEGAALPPTMAERVRRARPDDVLFLWDGKRLTLLDVKPELQTILGVLAREGDLFPPESQPALLGTLARWASRLPVAMPRSVMGESVPSLCSPVLRLAPQADGGVEIEVLVRPLVDSVAMVPGAGARDVHVRRGERAFHAVRDLKRELDAATTLANELPFSSAEPLEGSFRFHFADGGAVLDLLAACERRDPRPELEWVGKPLHNYGARGARSLRVTLDERQAWFGALGGLSVEGERVELARLLDSARRKERYVRVSLHTYVELEETLRRHLESLADHAHTAKRGVSMGPSAAPTLHALEHEGACLETGAAFRELALRIEASRALAPIVPPSLHAELRPYQLEGFRWLSRLAAWGAGGILADDMGLGKTVQTLALLLDRAPRGPALVVAPTSVGFNWKDEAERFAPSLRTVVYADAEDRDRALEGLGAGDVLIVSYGLLVRDAEKLCAVRFATVALDEAQNLKNAGTRRFRAARALDAEFLVALSGTPMENHLGELWALFAIVFPWLLGSWSVFRKRYALPIEKNFDPAAAPALARVIGPFLLRRTKAEVESDLPARTEVRVPVVLSAAEWALYEDARLASLSDLESRRSALAAQERRIDVLAALTRLRLLASHPRLYDSHSDVSSAKLARLLELVEELRAEGQRSLVFSQFTSHLALVRDALEKRAIGFVYLDGSTPQNERRERVRSFREGAAPVFLLSLKAAGVGLNLTAATNVILLDPWWNPAVEDQASDRAHRLGQTRPVTIYRLVSLGTIEEKMLSLHETKRSLIAQVLGGVEAASSLSTDDLVDLLSPGTTTSTR